ncbi:alpha-L-iduronidase-like [Pecten maximus]|uniref:alpha-L-iduronidase-like n=1 Tax=Pecten maximus TaxID=6579 RepID=UPI001458C374|nr:alpha-L-iduronidase-like [Pecten maximus]
MCHRMTLSQTSCVLTSAVGIIMCVSCVSRGTIYTLSIIMCVTGMTLCVSCVPRGTTLSFSLVVNSTQVSGDLDHFWRSTGFCPPAPHQSADKFDLSHDMRLNLALVASVPNKGMKQVRIHWLFDLVKVVGFQRRGYAGKPVKDSRGSNSVIEHPKGDNPVYDFSMLDKLLLILFQNNLKPGFELMGSPSNFFTDFENHTQVVLWKNLVFQTAERYIQMFGISYVKSWNFETWNEPDCGDFDNISMSVQGYLNYYDACSEGLLAASSELVLGGPGDGCDRKGRTKYSDGFLDHIVRGRNYFTGEVGVRLNFLSYHRKGNRQTNNIINGEIKTVAKIRKNYPSLARKPFYNDEGDPLVGWSRPEVWRADATYAAMVTKVIGQHQNIVLRGGAQREQMFNFSLLSNDNGFLSWYPFQFTQRTLNARFQINNTHPPHTQFLRKPVHSAMVLLSLLGNHQLHVNFSESILGGKHVKNDSFVGVIASCHRPESTDDRDSRQITVVLYNSDDTRSSANQTVSISVRVIGNIFDLDETMIVGYTVDNAIKTGNVYLMWSQFGKPKYPSPQQFLVLRQHEGPHRFLLTKYNSAVMPLESIDISLPQPSVKVLHICAKPRESPGQVTSVILYNITSGQVLISWADTHVTTKCILTYEVEFSHRNLYGPYIRVNNYDVIVTAFVFAPSLSFEDQCVMGYYRVRAVDYWQRGGKYSIPVKYPS